MISNTDAAGRVEPDWVRHAIWWQLYPLGFVGSYPIAPGGTVPTAGEHRLLRIVAWLDHAIELGASGVALGPIFASTTHGYDTSDYYRIDPRLGDDADFDTLIAEAHKRGLRVLLDGVFNHVGPDFPRYREALEKGPGSAAAAWFQGGAKSGTPAGTPGGGEGFGTFEGHPGLIALDHGNPEVADYVTGVLEHWLDRGADGWRLDAAYAVPAEFWARVLPRVREQHPQAWFLGEVIHGDYPEIVSETTLDSVTQYELWKAIWSSINDHNPHELAWSLGRHNGFLDSFTPATFVGNHDVTRIESRLDDPRHLAHALAVLFTTGGTPSVYAGDEYGYSGLKTEEYGGDDAIRPEFPADGPPVLTDTERAVYRLHQDLIGLRRRHPWLHEARTRILDAGTDHLVYEARAGDDALVVALNLGDQPCGVDVGRSGLVALVPGDTPTPEGSRVTIAPHGWQVLAPAADDPAR